MKTKNNNNFNNKSNNTIICNTYLFNITLIPQNNLIVSVLDRAKINKSKIL